MSACPSHAHLFRLLYGQLDQDDEAALVAHAETCKGCQERLETLTRGLLAESRGLEPKEAATTTTDPSWEKSPSRADRDTDEDLTVDRPYAAALEITPAAPLDRADSATDPDPLWGLHPRPSDQQDGANGVDQPSGQSASLTTEREEPERSITDPDASCSLIQKVAGRSPGGGERPGTSLPTIPGYEILKKLGEGGMGIVYKARQVGLNRLVALKMIRTEGNLRPDRFARFQIEAVAVAQLRHPKIPMIFEIGKVSHRPFVSLELLEGGTLKDRLKGTPQAGRVAAELIATLAETIQAAHRVGIVHRDLKPSNILFSVEGVPKITDFGLAKRLGSDSDQTESGQIMGSPSYMAPEQAQGRAKEAGPTADVYSLGAVLYELLTGRPPFRGETPLATMHQVANDDPVPPSRLVPKVARDLETICLKCLAKEPRKRYDSAQALADDLGRYLVGKPIKARPTPFLERGIKWTRRHPVPATVMIASVVVAISLLVAYIRYQRGVDRQIAMTTSKSAEVIFQAQEDMAQHQLDQARTRLLGLLPKIEGEPRLRDLHARARSLLTQIDSRIDDDRQREQDGKRYQQFLRKRNETQFHETQFTGLDVAASRKLIQQSARDALAVFTAPGSGETWSLGPLPRILSQRKQDEVREGCYELLLILADSVDQPDQGLRFLDSSVSLHSSPTRAYHLLRAACLARRGDTTGAEQERQAAERLQPATALDHFLMGKERYKRQQWGLAIPHFDTALQLQPDHFWANTLSALCCLGLQRYSEAKIRLNACLQREPDHPWLYVWRGFASSHVAAQAAGPVEKPPSDENTLAKDVELQFQAAESDYRRALELLEQKPDQDLRYVLLINRGLLELQRRKWDQAEADWQEAIRLDERRYQAHGELASLYLRENKPDAAIEQFSRAIALQPESALLYRGRADAEIAYPAPTNDQRARALNDLEQAIRLENPGDPVLARDQTNRGRLLVRERRDEEALAAFEAALKVVPDYTEAHRMRLDLLGKLKRHSEVIQSCDALLAQAKPSAELYQLRGLAKERLKDYPGAIADFTQAIVLRPGSAPLLAHRGELYLVTDAPRPAVRDFEEAIRRDPSNPDAYNGRGLARAILGDHRKAVADALIALRMAEPTPRRLYNAARIYAKAAIAATGDVRRAGRDAAFVVTRYQDQAVALVRESYNRLPAAQRASFWRDVIQTDPALTVLRRRLRAIEPAGPATSADH